MRSVSLLTFLVAGAPLFAQPTIIDAGYRQPVESTLVSPGQIVTLFARGLKRPLTAPDATASTLPLPTVLGGVSVRVKSIIPGYPAFLPLLSVRNRFDGSDRTYTQITVQIPTESTCLPVPNGCSSPGLASLTVEEDGQPGAEFRIQVLGAAPHILNTCDTVVYGGPFCYPIITHADGSLVWSGTMATSGTPARPGEVIVIYAVGLGQTEPSVPTGKPAPSPHPVAAKPPMQILYRTYTASLDFQWPLASDRLTPEFAGLVPGYVGLYQVNLRLPATIPSGAAECTGAGSAYVRLLINPFNPGQPGLAADFADFCVAP